MLEKERLTTRQLALLIIAVLIGGVLINYPSTICIYAQQDAWISSIIGSMIGIGLVWILYRLYRVHPGKNLIQICREILGFWLGTVLSVFYLFFFVIKTALFCREIADFMNTEIYPFTPMLFVVTMFLLPIVWGIQHGLGTIGRSNEILLPIVILSLLFVTMLLVPQLEISRIFPIFENGVLPIAKGTVFSSFYPFGELIVFMMIFPYTNEQPHTKRDVLLASSVGGVMLIFIVFITLLTMGPLLTKNAVYSAYVASQKVTHEIILQRIEFLTIFAWVICTYFKAMLYYYAFLVGSAELFKLKQYRFLNLPTAFLILGLSVTIGPNIKYILLDFVPSWTAWNSVMATIIPLLLSAVYAIRCNKKNVS